MQDDEHADSRGWTTWAASWLATAAACLVAVVAVSQLSTESFEATLEQALADHLGAEAGLAAAALQDLPVETVAELGGGRSTERIASRLEAVRRGGWLHDLALIGPDGAYFGAAGHRVWVAEAADRALIEDAAEGAVRVGPLYRGQDDDSLYLAAYAPFSGHSGWVVAVEGSGATLSAVDDLERRQVGTGVAALLVALLIGALLAGVVARPLRRLRDELATIGSTADPESISARGLREVRQVAAAVRAMLATIRERDCEIRASHDRELRQVTALAAAVAHEVRNPLNALGLNLNRLGPTSVPEARAAAHGEALALVEEVDGIVDRFLDVARVPSPEPSLTPLAPLLAEVQQEATLAGLEAHMSCPDMDLVTDGRLLRQALRNLVTNARQAGAGRVTIAVSPGPEMVRIDVTDDGPGIAADIAPHLFDWFETTRATGTGLGLPMARRAMRALGGDVGIVTLRPATFRITLPWSRP